MVKDDTDTYCYADKGEDYYLLQKYDYIMKIANRNSNNMMRTDLLAGEMRVVSCH